MATGMVQLKEELMLWEEEMLARTLTSLRNNPFNIDLMPVTLDSFDVIIRMDWLTKYHGVIICDEKIVPQKYLSKGYGVFLAHITTKEAKDKSEGKRLEDVPIVRDFPEVFLEDLPDIPPAR
ncbi:hypothetical protein Tco_0109194 [Tanacetum coccineum]